MDSICRALSVKENVEGQNNDLIHLIVILKTEENEVRKLYDITSPNMKTLWAKQ